MSLVRCMLTGLMASDCVAIFLRRSASESSDWRPASYPFDAWFNWGSTQLEPSDGYVIADSVRSALLSGAIQAPHLREQSIEILTNAMLDDQRGNVTLSGEDLGFGVISEPILSSYLDSLGYEGEQVLRGAPLDAAAPGSPELAECRRRLAGIEHLLARLEVKWESAQFPQHRDSDLLLRSALSRFQADGFMLEALAEYVRWEVDESITLDEIFGFIERNEQIFEG